MNSFLSPLENNWVDILGVHVHIISVDDLLNYIIIACRQGQKVIISNANVHAINLAYRIPWYRSFLNQSHIVFCDGFGVKWAAKFLHRRTLYRHTPPDWLPKLAEECVRHDLTLYFLGAKPGIAEKAAVILMSQHPGLKIVGTHHGYFDKSPDSVEQRKVINEINALKPDILLIGFGMPAQEEWLMDNWEKLNAHAALPVGALFDYASGTIRRAPAWMTAYGLEWLGRLIIEPRRLWKRYLIGNSVFILRVILCRFGLLKTTT